MHLVDFRFIFTDRYFLTKRVHAYRYIVIDSQVTQITGFRLLKKGFHDSDLSNTEVLIPQMIIKHRDCAVKTITNDWYIIIGQIKSHEKYLNFSNATTNSTTLYLEKFSF